MSGENTSKGDDRTVPRAGRRAWLRPIFILGISQRSGTNYLWHLLRQHPGCSAGRLPEDFALHHAENLDRFARDVSSHWEKSWRMKPEDEASLRRELGRGVINFMNRKKRGQRPIMKTPSVRNLDLLFDFFPGASLLILVRDGRAVVESGVRSFGGSAETWTREWVKGARTIEAFKKGITGRRPRYRIVKYEDLWRNQGLELRRIFRFLGLDRKKYDFKKAAQMPVRGSSELKAAGDNEIHWRPVTPGPDFDPLARWRGWSRAQRERFQWIASRELQSLGYEPEPLESARPAWALWNSFMDLKWSARSVARNALGAPDR